MTIQHNMRFALRLTLVAGISTFGVLTSPHAYAQDGSTESSDATDVYFLRANHEYSDGHSTHSKSQDIVIGRARRGDRSMILQDFQAGAVTIESGGKTVAASTASPRGHDVVTAYDYSNGRASGDGSEVAVFNTHMRPLIASFPAPGPEGRWTAQTSLGALGLSGQTVDSAVRIDLRRERLNHQGHELVLIEYEIPAFAYQLPGGEAVTHWARGVAVTDPDFAVIEIAASQHRATAIAADGSVRPFTVRSSLHGIEPDGRMKLRLQEAPQVAAAVRRLHETRGDRNLALNRWEKAESFPREVAARLDMASYSIGEGGGNPLPVTTDGAQPEQTDSLPPGSQNGTDAFRSEARDVLISKGMSSQDVDRLLDAIIEPDLSRDWVDRYDEVREFQSDMFRVMPSYEEGQRPISELTPSEIALKKVLQTYVRVDDYLIIEARLQDARYRERDRWVEGGGSVDDPEFQAAAKEAKDRQDAILNKRYERLLQDIRLTNDQMPGGSELGNQLVPGWLTDDPDSVVDEELYALLQEEMRREMEEIEELLQEIEEEREQQSENSVYDDTDDFFTNNAFTYTDMIGTVATDLSRWADWLATQNERELERLALQAGYPNLASALNDADNIIRQSQDAGYRQWALRPPSCGGYVGCGPSYLERWAMKSSIVALGDILNDSRDIFSTGGFNDIGISGLNLSYLLRDNALEDGDIVRVNIQQFGRTIFEGQVSLTNAGNMFDQGLGRGVASLEIFAVNEGTASPNTAQISIDNVVRGEGTQSYSLRTGETATLRIEAGASGN